MNKYIFSYYILLSNNYENFERERKRGKEKIRDRERKKKEIIAFLFILFCNYNLLSIVTIKLTMKLHCCCFGE